MQTFYLFLVPQYLLFLFFSLFSTSRIDGNFVLSVLTDVSQNILLLYCFDIIVFIFLGTDIFYSVLHVSNAWNFLLLHWYHWNKKGNRLRLKICFVLCRLTLKVFQLSYTELGLRHTQRHHHKHWPAAHCYDPQLQQEITLHRNLETHVIKRLENNSF